MGKLNILIIIPRYTGGAEAFTTHLPLGIAYVVSIIEQNGYDVDVLNLDITRGDIKESIIERLDQGHYNIVGTGGTAFEFNAISTILSIVKEYDNSIITLLGGRIIFHDVEEIFSELDADYGIIGDADVALPALLNKFTSNSDEVIENTVYKENGTIKTAPFVLNKNLVDAIPYPNYEKCGYGDRTIHSTPDFYFESNWKSYNIISGFNCFGRCTFCANSVQRYRKRSVENIIQEMDYAIKKFDIDVFVFVSDVFTEKWDDVEDLCNKINILGAEHGKKIRFQIAMRIKGFTLEKAMFLKESGCISILFGFESYDDDVLKSMRKGITASDIDQAIQVCRIAKITYRGWFIFGDIAETVSSYKKTLNYWKEVGRGFILFSPIAPLPGSYLMDYCLKNGIIKDKLNFYKNEINNAEGYFYISKKMSVNMTMSEHKKMLRTIFAFLIKYQFYQKGSKKKNTSDNSYTIQYHCGNCTSLNTEKKSHVGMFSVEVCADCGAMNYVHTLPKISVSFGVEIASFFISFLGIDIFKVLMSIKRKFSS